MIPIEGAILLTASQCLSGQRREAYSLAQDHPVVFIPLSDDNPLRYIHYQWVTVGLIAANVVVFIWQNTGVGPTAAASFALIPTELFQVHILGGSAHGPYDTIPVPEAYTLLTYMFLHGGIIHLSSNMLFLWVFGDNVEDAMGHLKYLAFYLICGVAAGLAHAFMLPNSKLPLIGASGAVAGVIGAYLLLHPRVRVWVLAFRFIPLRISAAWVLGVWVATQLAMAFLNQSDEVAWWAHIGGVAAGAILVLVMRRPGVPLFDRRLDTASN
jgi:membrane associated rhomboid family serine protease